MSGYGKQAPPQLHGFDTSRPFSEPTFAFSAAPPFASQSSVSPAQTPSFHNEPQMAQISYSNQGRTTYDDQSGPYLNVGSTPVPQVASYQPSQGGEGTKVSVYISSLYELMTTNTPTFSLMFGSRKCAASISKLAQQGGVCQYVVTTDVPAFSTTGWSSQQVPICLLMESVDGEIVGKVDVGRFTFLNDEFQSVGVSQSDISRKRKLSDDSSEIMRSPAKRTSLQHVRSGDGVTSYNYGSSDDSSFSPYLQPSSAYGLMPQYGRSQGQYQPQSTRNLYQYTNSSAASPSLVKAQSPHGLSFSPYSTVSSHIARSPGNTGSTSLSRPNLGSLPSPLPANPPLIRTLTLQQNPSPASTPAGVPSGQTFNPYALYPHKAEIKIQGDLDAMAEGWTVDEWKDKRRIVLFKRAQQGNTITMSFAPVAVDERPPNSVCISCIYWEEKKECFVTSVDTIYLLESLIAARFTVEEKNRIRRNLEGFKPVTVAKSKPASEEFFKLIMSFPKPKPRNIEKDIKVFPWRALSHGLKKVISKYSASPSSTLPPAMLTPVSSTGYATDVASAGFGSGVSDHSSSMISPHTVSRSISGPSGSAAYAAPGGSRVLSPPVKTDMSQHGGPSDLRVSVSNYDGLSGTQSNQWSTSSHHMASTQYRPLSNQNSRGSWDLSTYLDPSPASAVSGNGTQTLGYGRSTTEGPVSGSNTGKLRGAQGAQ